MTEAVIAGQSGRVPGAFYFSGLSIGKYTLNLLTAIDIVISGARLYASVQSAILKFNSKQAAAAIAVPGVGNAQSN